MNKNILIVLDVDLKRLDSGIDFNFSLMKECLTRKINIEYVIPTEPCNLVKEKLKEVNFRYTTILNWWNKRDIYKRNDVRTAFKILRIIKRKKIDLVAFSFTSEILVFLIACVSWLLFCKPIMIWHQHGEIRINKPDSFIKKNFSKLRILSWVIDAVCPVFQKQESLLLLRGIAQSKIKTIYNGVNLDRFKFPINQKPSIPEFDTHGKETVVITVATLVPNKGINYLLEAANLILRKISNVKFVIVGEGPSALKLKELAEKLGVSSSVIFTGKRSDVPDLMMMSDIFVLPTLTEAFPGAILEAMAASKPVIASNIAGIPEEVIDGETGLLVPPKDVRRLVEAISTLLSNKELAFKMGLRGRKRVEEKFSLERTINEYVGFYESLLKS